jgi:hypothetical protein
VVVRAQQSERVRRIGVLMSLSENDAAAKAQLSEFTKCGLFHSSTLFGTLAARDHALFKIGIASPLR